MLIYLDASCCLVLSVDGNKVEVDRFLSFCPLFFIQSLFHFTICYFFGSQGYITRNCELEDIVVMIFTDLGTTLSVLLFVCREMSPTKYLLGGDHIF